MTESQRISKSHVCFLVINGIEKGGHVLKLEPEKAVSPVDAPRYRRNIQCCNEVMLIQGSLSSIFWLDPGKVIRRCLHPLRSSMSNWSRPFPLLNLSRLPTIEEPLRHKDQRIERTDRDCKTHRSTKDDYVTRARPLARLLIKSPVEILHQVSELRGA